MTGHLIGYAILAAGTAGIVYAFTRRWAAEFRRAAEASLVAVAPASADDGRLVGPVADWDGPIVVEASELRGLIRDAVREALAAEARSPYRAGDIPPSP